MNTIRFTLIGDGRSDRALIPIIQWLFNSLYPTIVSEIQYFDTIHIKTPPKKDDVIGQINYAKEYYPFDILIYHRDAEANTIKSVEERKKEILQKVNDSIVVCVIPIRMMETWLLIDSLAIKKAAGNRSYNGNLTLPDIKNLEVHKKPKKCLHDLLVQASNLNGRGKQNFNVHKAVHLVADNITDYSLLRNLDAFKLFEKDFQTTIDNYLKSTS